MPKLTRQQLHVVEDAALAAELADPERRPLLLGDLDARIRTHLPTKSRPSDQLASDLAELNTLDLLPFWLRQAIRLSVTPHTIATFEDALHTVQPPPTMSAALSHAELVAWLDVQLGRWQKDITAVARRSPGAADDFRADALALVQRLQRGEPVQLGQALTAIYTRAGLPAPRPPTQEALEALGPVRGPESNSLFLGRLTRLLGQSEQLLQKAAVVAGAIKNALNTPPQATGPAMTVPGSPSADAVSIVVITALPKEEAAVRKVLGLNFRQDASGPVSRTYHLGVLPAANGGSHTVAVVRLTDMGNNSAAIAATNAVHHFPRARHLIMCGIAGGARHESDVQKPLDLAASEHDVRLGDIVVSDRNGVVQYDMVKEGARGIKEYRHPPRPPGPTLLRATQHLQTETLLGNRAWEAHLALAATLEGAGRPPDNLNAKGEAIEYPQDPARRAEWPRVFSGTIAASNTLLKNPKHRDTLQAKFKVKAIEMEGSGVADASWEAERDGYLVVRGICDYCDRDKGNFWQMPAAVAAAAYTRAVIEAMAAQQDASPRP